MVRSAIPGTRARSRWLEWRFGRAVAAGLCYGSIGTDTGGSIRIPASLSGVTGLKPSWGRISCEGIVPLSPAFDCAGPLGRTVGDVAILTGALYSRVGANQTWQELQLYGRARGNFAWEFLANCSSMLFLRGPERI